MNAIVKQDAPVSLPVPNENELLELMQKNLYPGSQLDSVKMVRSYCAALQLDPMQKPVHIVPMWDSKAGAMRDVVMPGIGLYRIQAARTGCYAGVSEPEYGPEINEKVGSVSLTFPAWCRVTVKRRLLSGELAEFTAKEFWKENYARKGGKDRDESPNEMWRKRTYAQLAKCAEAQALRKAFPEVGSQPTAEEMIGKTVYEEDGYQVETTARKPPVEMPKPREIPKPVLEAVTDVVQAIFPKPDSTQCTEGEIKYLLKKISDKGMTIAAAREAAGLDVADTLDGLTKDGFIALRDVVV